MKLRAGFNLFVDVLGAVIFSTITLVSFAQIVNRYVFGQSFVFAEEMATQLMIWIAFLGAAKCVSIDAHTRLSVVVNKLPLRLKCAAMLLSNALCMIFLGAAGWYGYGLVRTTWRGTTIGTGVPEGLIYLAMPVSSAIMIVFLAINSFETVAKLKSAGEDAR